MFKILRSMVRVVASVTKKQNSQTGTRTRVAWVKATYPNRLDYLGVPSLNQFGRIHHTPTTNRTHLHAPASTETIHSASCGSMPAATFQIQFPNTNRNPPLTALSGRFEISVRVAHSHAATNQPYKITFCCLLYTSPSPRD